MGKFNIAREESEGIQGKEMSLGKSAKDRDGCTLGLWWREILWIIIGQSERFCWKFLAYR